MDLLVIENVVKVFGNTNAVDHISLRVPEQTIFGLLGPNGAGKTTLIRMITDILYQDSGTILLNNIPITPREVFSLGICPKNGGYTKR